MSSILQTLIFIGIAIFIQSNVLAQSDFQEVRFQANQDEKRSTYILTGTVKSLESNETLSGISIHIDGFFSGINTDNNGLYLIELDSGIHRVVFRQISKKPVFYTVALFGNGVIDVIMDNKDFELEMFTVLSEEKDRNVREPITGVTKMNIEEIKLIPAFLGEPDVINTLQLMPGITSVGEGSSGLNVRGGQADQNLLMMNEAIVLSNSHALGFLSSFNSDAVQNFSLFKGAVPSYFGGRSASALNIEMKKGDFENWSYQGSLGTATSKIMVEGPILPEKTSMIAAARRSNVNGFLNFVKEPDVKNSRFNFHDIYVGLNHKFSDKHFLDLNLLQTGDDFQLSDQFGFKWKNLVTYLASRNLIFDNFSLVSLFAYGNFNNSFYEPSGIDPAIINNGLTYQQAKVSGFLTVGEMEIIAGVEAVNYQSKPETLSPYTRDSGVIPEQVNKPKGLEWAPFVALEWNLTDQLAFSGGLRYSNYMQLGPDSVNQYLENQPLSPFTITERIFYGNQPIVKYGGFEPRFSFSWNFKEEHSIKGGYSSMYQYLQTISNTTGPSPIDLWQLSTDYILPQRSHNFSLGYFRNLKDNEWSTSIEGYFRNSENQIDYKDFADLFLNPHIETELVQGIGKAYGVELLIQRNSGTITGWLAYTYSRSWIRTHSPYDDLLINGGQWYPTNYDKPHIVSLVSSIHINKGRSFNVSSNFASGRPVTSPTVGYLVDGILIPDYGDRNSFRIPNYFRVDLSYLTNGFFRELDDRINISFYNLLGRRNAYSVFFQREQDTSRLIPYRVSILGAVFPSFTYTIKFAP